MDKVSSKLTVFFEDPFWVGVFEHIENEKLSVAKVTFGAEPKEYDIQEYIQKCYYGLQFSPAMATVVKETKRNPNPSLGKEELLSKSSYSYATLER